MVFSSLTFLLLFLPAVTAVYYACPRRFRNAWLLASSLAFYGFGSPRFLAVFAASMLWNYAFGLIIGRLRGTRAGKAALWLCLAGDLGLLAVFKYANFAADTLRRLGGVDISLPTIALPIGISFFTFQEISCAVDVYRGAEPQRNPVKACLYIAFFPQLIAGPILRYGQMRGQIDARRETLDDFAEGFFRFAAGLCKKVLLANQLGQLTDYALSPGRVASCSAPLLLLSLFAYALQLYLDFSAYSDMAIGLGRMFGFRMPENFNLPYLADSAADFWRRWHISLSGWFRDYVYIPLGGSRCGRGAAIRNLLVVWLLTGLWHGASWPCVLWGLIWGAWLVAEKYLLRPESRGRHFRRCYRALTILLAMLLFSCLRFPSLARMAAVFRRIAAPDAWTDAGLRLWAHDLWPHALVSLAVSFGLPRRLRAWAGRRPGLDAAARLLSSGLLLLGVLLSLSFLAGSAYNPFLYFQF